MSVVSALGWRPTKRSSSGCRTESTSGWCARRRGNVGIKVDVFMSSSPPARDRSHPACGAASARGPGIPARSERDHERDSRRVLQDGFDLVAGEAVAAVEEGELEEEGEADEL